MSAAGDRFGAAVATADLNGDGCGDLAIGLPGEDRRSGCRRRDLGLPDRARHSRRPPRSSGRARHRWAGALEAGDGFGTTLAPAGSLRHRRGGRPVGRRSRRGRRLGQGRRPGHRLKATAGGLLGASRRPELPPGHRRGPRQRLRPATASASGSPAARVPCSSASRARTSARREDAGSVLALTLSSGAWRAYNQNSCRHPGHGRGGGPVRRIGRPRGRLRGGHGRDLGDRCAGRGHRSHRRNAGTVTLRDRSSGAAITFSQGARGVPGAGGDGRPVRRQPRRRGRSWSSGAPREDVGTAADAGAISLVEIGCTAGRRPQRRRGPDLEPSRPAASRTAPRPATASARSLGASSGRGRGRSAADPPGGRLAR